MPKDKTEITLSLSTKKMDLQIALNPSDLEAIEDGIRCLEPQDAQHRRLLRLIGFARGHLRPSEAA